MFSASQGNRGPPGLCGPKGITVSSAPYVSIQLRLKGRVEFDFFFSYQGHVGDYDIEKKSKESMESLGFQDYGWVT